MFQGACNAFCRCCLAAVLLACLYVGTTQAAPLRLFNGPVNLTNAPAARSRSAYDGHLALVQLRGHVTDGTRHELAANGVELLRYISDDGFIAKLHGISRDDAAKLSPVAAVGDYRPEYRKHPALNLSGLAGVNSVKVAALLAAGTDDATLASLSNSFAGAPQLSRTRVGIVLRGNLASSQLDAFAANDAVLWLEPARELRLQDEVAAKLVGGDGGPHLALNQRVGFDGSGVTVAVADSGIDTGDPDNLHPELAGRVVTNILYGSLTNGADYYNHGTGVAGCVGGDGYTGLSDADGALYGLGIAPSSLFVNQRIFDDNGTYVAGSVADLTRDALLSGAIIANNSWGQVCNGAYDTLAQEYDILVRDADLNTTNDDPFIVVCATGNSGPNPGSLLSPAVGKNIIAVGGSLNARTNLAGYNTGPEAMYNASGRGPTADGRIKPDLVAPAAWVATLRPTMSSGGIDDLHSFEAGTSFACPQVSGAAAAFVHFFRDTHTNNTPSPAQVKAALINSAHALTSLAPVPNPDEGWGRSDLGLILNASRTFNFIDTPAALTNSQVYTNFFVVNTTNKTLVVTLAYTDYPGTPASAVSLVNDLDLQLISPEGHVYRGNQFDTNGLSLADVTTTDRTNNVEGIRLVAPEPGLWTLLVIATNLPADSLAATPATDQDFALAVSGDLPLPGAGSVTLNRQAYSAPQPIVVTVTDDKRSGSSFVQVRARSTVEPLGENYVLNAAAVGVFTGRVFTATGPAVSDNRLEVAHNSTINVDYFDVVAGTNVTATAGADLLPPQISGVTAAADFGRVTVEWQTDEPATSFVQFGTNALNLGTTNSSLVTAHALTVGGLAPGQSYKFKLVSTDAAGNAGTNDNAGAYFTFTAPIPAPVLLVDSYVQDSLAPVIPLSTYTNAFAEAGVRCDVWPAAELGSPVAADLTPYRAVVWRVSDSFRSTNSASTLTFAQQGLIENYVTNGGGFFLASMEILARLGPVPFRYNLLQVEDYSTNSIPYFYCPDCDENGGVASVDGESGDPITAGLSLTPDYSDYPAGKFVSPDDGRTDLGDTFTLHDTGARLFTETTSGRTVGMRWPQNVNSTTGKVVFLSFPLDTVPDTSRAVLVQKALQYLAPGSTNPPGTIRITNNLRQATVNLSGPLALTRQGASATVDYAPVGTYVATFGAVPFYTTPTTQTNTLASGVTVTFTGNYTFTDANSNGISDAWEQFYFATVATNRTAFTDTDGDGMTDYAEFIAGTIPTNAASVLKLSVSFAGTNTVRVDWPAVVGRSYRPLAADDTQSFAPLSGWGVANTNALYYTLPMTNAVREFRVEVTP